MRGFPRTCDDLLCDEDATIRFRGWWCGVHALKRFGKRDVILAARFSELHRSLEASRSLDPDASAVGREDAGVGFIPLTRQVPPSEGPSSGEASVVASVAASEPPPLTDDELATIQEMEGEWAGW